MTRPGAGHDVVVVGAGSAGCVVARRLVDAGASVLLLEAGPDARFAAVTDPARMHELWHGPLDWDVQTVPQAHAHDRQLHLPRGRVLGGSHALNAMIWVRGNPADYDGWAAAGLAGWSWADVEPVFDALECSSAADGILPLLTDYEPDPLHRSIVAAAQNAGVEFNPDYNGASQDGVSYCQFTLRDGRRCMTADAYLRPVRADPLLTVRGDCTVDRLELSGDRCVGVHYLRGAEQHLATADEVIVCAGAIGSPAILQRSGVGAPDLLARHHIPLRVPAPAVGSNLHDHWLVPVIFGTDREPEVSPGLPTPQSHLFWRSRPGLAAPDVQPIHFGVPLLAAGMSGPAQGFSLMAGLVRPLSRGTVRIASSDPARGPLVDPQVLSADEDVEVLLRAVRLCAEIGAQEPLATGWGARACHPGPDLRDDAALRDYIRETVVTYHHQAGTCAMGAGGSAVVDNRLRVHGVVGLRVADASVMPTIVTGNTNAAAVMIGERAAAFSSGH